MEGTSYRTASRRKILEFLQSNSDRTVNAADIDTYLKESGSDVNLTTIYRYLDKLTKEGTLIRYASDKGGHAAYQYVEQGHGCDAHLHMKCVQCGRIIHLDCGFMKEIAEHIEQDHGFALQCKNSILYGVCRACQTAPDQPSP